MKKNKKKKEVPTRPTLDEVIIKEGIAIFCQKHSDFNHDHLMEIYDFGADGYQLAKSLEELGYEPSESMVSELGFLDAYIADAENEAVKKWVKNHKVQPKLRTGHQVKFTIENGDLTGVIWGHDISRGYYLIKRDNDPDASRKYVVAYENAISIDKHCMKEIEGESAISGCAVCPQCGLGPCRKHPEKEVEATQHNCSKCSAELPVKYRIFYPNSKLCQQCTFERR